MKALYLPSLALARRNNIWIWFKWLLGSVLALMLALAGSLFWLHEDVVLRVPSTQDIVALTFDDGPHPVATQALLSLLADRGVHADADDPAAQAPRGPSVAATGIIIDKLHSEGYRFLTVGELIEQSSTGLAQ